MVLVGDYLWQYWQAGAMFYVALPPFMKCNAFVALYLGSAPEKRSQRLRSTRLLVPWGQHDTIPNTDVQNGQTMTEKRRKKKKNRCDIYRSIRREKQSREPCAATSTLLHFRRLLSWLHISAHTISSTHTHTYMPQAHVVRPFCLSCTQTHTYERKKRKW